MFEAGENAEGNAGRFVLRRGFTTVPLQPLSQGAVGGILRNDDHLAVVYRCLEDGQDIRVAPDLGPKAGLLANCCMVHVRWVRQLYGESCVSECSFAGREPYLAK